MSLKSILEQRYSARAYSSKPVSEEVIKDIFSTAQRSASNCNVQPWQTCVVSGETKNTLSKKFMELIMSGAKPNPDFNWVPQYQGHHRDRQFASANALYSSMEIPREDKQARQMAMIRNWQFFDAPHVVFFTMDKYLDIMGAVDLGIYAQTVSLLLQEQGISSCMQGALGQFPDPIRTVLDLPEERGVLFGMSFGYADEASPVNKTRTERESVNTSVNFYHE